MNTSRCYKRNAKINSMKYLLVRNVSHSFLTTALSELLSSSHAHTESVPFELDSVSFTAAHRAGFLLVASALPGLSLGKPFRSCFPTLLNKLLPVILPPRANLCANRSSPLLTG